MHYSFDYAQQEHYPSNALQSGQVFFKTARRYQVFGVCCEPKHFQVNYLVDKDSYIGKGANSTISLLHDILEHYGGNEEDIFLMLTLEEISLCLCHS